MGKTTITDIPRKGAVEQDRFGLMAYERGLETFLRGASTPITVALQGEWGSGKTSLHINGLIFHAAQVMAVAFSLHIFEFSPPSYYVIAVNRTIKTSRCTGNR